MYKFKSIFLVIVTLILKLASSNETDIEENFIAHDLTPMYISHLKELEENEISSLLSEIAEAAKDKNNLTFIEEYKADYEEHKRSFQIYAKQGNPLDLFRLVRRLSRLRNSTNITLFKEKEKGINIRILNVCSKKSFSEQEAFKDLPVEYDLANSISSLLRLQLTYSLSPFDLVQGIVSGVKTGIKLNAEHSLQISQHALYHEYYSFSLEWLQAAVKLNKKEKRFTSSELNEVAESIMTTHDEDYDTKRKKRHMFIYLQPLSNLTKSASSLAKLTPETMPSTTLGQHEMGKMLLSGLKKTPYHMMALCQGHSFQTKADKSKLKCWRESSRHPYFYIQPIKAEQLGGGLTLFHSLIGEKQIESLKNEAMEKIVNKTKHANKSQLTDGNVVSFEWLHDEVDEVWNLKTKAKLLLGLETLDYMASELLRVALYSSGGGMKAHNDAWVYDKDSNKSTDPTDYEDRLATLLIYVGFLNDICQTNNARAKKLSDIEVGGSTAFTDLGLAVQPTKGSAIYWHLYHPNAKDLDWSLIHYACPVLLGSKIYTTLWIKKRANMLISKCPAAGQLSQNVFMPKHSH